MAQGRSHPDDTPESESEDEARGSTDPGPLGAWMPGPGAEQATPPSSWSAHDPAPGEPTRRGFETLPTARGPRERAGEEGPGESFGIHGPVQPGQVLFGRYRVEKMLGEGGMGTVWLVTHRELDTLRALKLIVSGIAFDPGAQARFQREARVMARLSHPNAVVVHDARMAHDAAFIEMEYIRGLSLNRRITAGVPMPLDWTAGILEQLCDVLEEAHRQKVVHRDLKPANLMLLDGRPVGREHLKVLDFGIAKILEGETAVGDIHTNTGNFLGSAPYTSPEQASGSAVDARSDLYSVGVILYELLTGYRPFTGPITRMIYDHLYSSPPRFAERNPAGDVPPEVERLVLRCLSKDPADRPSSARALSEQFLRALPGPPRGAGQVASGPARSDLPRTEHDPAARSTPAPLTEGIAWAAPLDRAGDPSTEGATRGLAHLAHPSESLHRTEGFASFPATPAPPALDRDRPVVPPALPTASTTRRRMRRLRLPAALGLAALVAAAAIAGWPRGRPGPVSGPPRGYAALEPADLVEGFPRVLVRQSDRTRFLRIPGGRFLMGNHFDRTARDDDDDQPAHPVEVSDFYLQETEVTNAEMTAYFLANRVDVARRPARWRAAIKRIEEHGHDPARYPAAGIPHHLAESYARWAGGALPTEAQWEYAARSRGKNHPFVWGTEPLPDPKYANVDSVGLIGTLPTAEVGKYPRDRTEQGVLDLTGNVREWCRDVWSPYVTSANPLRNPQGPSPSSKTGPADFVIRGGSFAFWKDRTRTTRPRRPEPSDLTAEDLARDGSAEDLGFRVVLEWPR